MSTAPSWQPNRYHRNAPTTPTTSDPARRVRQNVERRDVQATITRDAADSYTVVVYPKPRRGAAPTQETYAVEGVRLGGTPISVPLGETLTLPRVARVVVGQYPDEPTEWAWLEL